MQPRIETSKNGARCLIVYYDPRIDDYAQAIDTAEKQLCVAGEKIGAIALPIETGSKYFQIDKD